MTPRVPTLRLCVKSLMEQRGLSPYALHNAAVARGHALSRMTIYRITSGGARSVSLATLAALCDVLECEPGELFVR